MRVKNKMRNSIMEISKMMSSEYGDTLSIMKDLKPFKAGRNPNLPGFVKLDFTLNRDE